MRQSDPPAVSTEQLGHLLAGDVPPWLVFAPDRAAFADGHIPGSMTATDTQLLTALPRRALVVLYGEDEGAVRARDLAATLSASGRDVRLYADGLRGWRAAGRPVERLT